MHTDAVRQRAIELYESGFSCRAAAERISKELATPVAYPTVARWARERGISRAVGDRRTVDLPKKAVDMYQSGLTMKEVAERFRLSKETVRERFREMGIRIRPRGLTYSRLADKEWLENEYWRKGRSARDIANRVGCSVLTVHYHLRRHRIPRKRKSLG